MDPVPRQLNRRRRAAVLALRLGAGAAMATGALRGQTQGDGSDRWPGPFSAGQNARIESSPAVGGDGTIYIGAAIDVQPPRGLLIAINRDGSLKWRPPVTMPDWVDSSPALSADGSTLYVGCWDGNLYALSTATGAQRWFQRTGEAISLSSPAVGLDGTVYVGAVDVSEGAAQSGLYAVQDLRSEGRLRWVKHTGSVESSPAIGADGTVYFGSFDRHAYALNPEDGSERWRFLTDEAIWGSPAIGPDGTVYIGTLTGRLYALSGDGTAKWEYATGAPIFGGPAVGADGTIYVGTSAATFHALNPDRSVRWTVELSGAILTVPAIRADGSVIVGVTRSPTTPGRIYALNEHDGSVKWMRATSHDVRTSPVVADGSLYFAAFDGRIHALNSSAAALSGQSSWPMFRGGPAHHGRVRAPVEGARLVNLSTRATMSADTNLITGFVVRGVTPKEHLVRAVGPTLAQFGVPNPLADPTITLRRQQTGALVSAGFNDNWNDENGGVHLSDAAARVGAFPLAAGSRDAAIVPLLNPEPYTATVGSADSGSGDALVEAYDVRYDEPGSRLVNLSTRGFVAPDRPIIPGLVVRGEGPLRLLIRAVGPGLAQFGVSNFLARPTLSVMLQQTVIRANAGWTTDGAKGDIAGAARQAGAFPLADNSLDSAALMDLVPGSYTIQVTGADNTSGEVLVEVYVAP